MTADDWEPSEEMVQTGWDAFQQVAHVGPAPMAAALIAVRPLIIAEAKPGIEREEAKKWKDTYDLVIAELKAEIEAAERERIAKHFEAKYLNAGPMGLAMEIRALKGDQP